MSDQVLALVGVAFILGFFLGMWLAHRPGRPE